MDIYNHFIKINENILINTITNGYKHRINHNVFFSTPHKKSKLFFQKICKKIIDESKTHQNIICIKNFNAKMAPFSSLTYSILQDILSAPFPYLRIKLKSFSIIQKIAYIFLMLFFSSLAIFIKMKLDNIYTINSLSDWVKASRDYALYPLMFNAVALTVPACIYYLQANNKYKQKFQVINEIVKDNSFHIAKKILNKKITSKNAPIFLVIENVEDLSEKEFELIFETVGSLSLYYKITIVSFSSCPGQMRMRLCEKFSPNFFRLIPNAEELEDKSSPSPQDIQTYEMISDFNLDFGMHAWTPWALLNLMVIGAGNQHKELSLNQFELITLDKINLINTSLLEKALPKTNKKEIKRLFKELKSSDRFLSLFYRFGYSRDAYIDKHIQLCIQEKMQKNIKLSFYFFWLLYLLEDGLKSAYSCLYCSHILKLCIKKATIFNEHVITENLIKALLALQENVVNSGYPELAYYYSQLMTCLLTKYSKSIPIGILNSMILYCNTDIETFKHLAHTSNSNEDNSLSLFYTIFKNDTTIDFIQSMPNDMDLTLYNYLYGKTYFQAILEHGITHTFSHLSPEEKVHVSEVLKFLRELPTLSGGFNISTFMQINLVSQISRINAFESFTILAKKIFKGTQQYSQRKSSWAALWSNIICMILLAEIFKIYRINSNSKTVSHDMYYDSICTIDGEIVELTNSIFRHLKFDVHLDRGQYVPPSILKKIDTKFREIIFILSGNSLWQIAKIVELYAGKFLLNVKPFDRCEKLEKEFILSSLEPTNNTNSPLSIFFNIESYMENISLNSTIYVKFTYKPTRLLYSFIQQYLSKKILDYTENIFFNHLIISNFSDDAKFVTKELFRKYINRNRNRLNNSEDSIDDIISDFFLAQSLFSNKNITLAKEISKKIHLAFSNLKRHNEDDQRKYIEAKYLLLSLDILLDERKESIAKRIEEFITGEEKYLLSKIYRLPLLEKYFTNCKASVDKNICTYIQNLPELKGMEQARHAHLLLTNICYSFFDKNKISTEEYFVLKKLYTLLRHANTAAIEPSSIIDLINLLYVLVSPLAYDDYFIDILRKDIESYRKKALIISLRKNRPLWMTQSSPGKLAQAFYRLFETQMQSIIPEHIINAVYEGTPKERVRKINAILNDNSTTNIHELWCNVFLIKNLELIARRYKIFDRDDIEKYWDNVSIDCFGSLVSRVMQLHADTNFDNPELSDYITSMANLVIDIRNDSSKNMLIKD
ncbi:MAG: hypothetical protein ACNI3A_16520 [Desulfovibrio sp.]|uniref:hypothetical protein n=1 Tax=Desulfovibrio sp. 7SRBS1 TaxID=3378064 RepID=UPI003B3E1BF1